MHELSDRRLLVEIKSVFEASRRTYGSPRVYDELRKKGLRCSLARVERLMRDHVQQAVDGIAPRSCLILVGVQRWKEGLGSKAGDEQLDIVRAYPIPGVASMRIPNHQYHCGDCQPITNVDRIT